MGLELPGGVTLREVAVRDGLQHEEFFVPTETKLYFLDRLAETGFKYLEPTSFAHPAYVPQFRDAEEVLKGIKRKEGIKYDCLTMNERALDRALASKEKGFGPDMVLYMISTSESHNKRNGGKSRNDSWKEAARLIKRARDAGLEVIGTIGTTFGCPIEGPVKMELAIEFADRFRELGVDELNFGDTTGEGTPDRVFDFYSMIMKRHKDVAVCAHFHESRGWGLANCLAALQAGVTFFDCGMGGLGGQPASIVDGVPVPGTGSLYTPSDITGNVRGEDLAVMLDEMGIETGIDISAYIELGREIEKVTGRELRSYCTKTGRIPKGRTGR